MLKSKPLVPGDKIAAISLSWGGPGTFSHRYEAGKAQLHSAFDLEVVETRHALKNADWIYKNPRARADDLMEAFSDPSIKAIISTIGGDESVRILSFLDLEIIRENPKIFLGYSDTTVTHFACFKAGLVSFYGPSIMAGFAENGGLFPYMKESVQKTLFSTAPIGIIPANEDGWTVEHLDWANPDHQTTKRKLRPVTGPQILQGQSVVRGHLIGGCVEVLEMLKGTEYWPSREIWDGAILFLETSEEAPGITSFERWIRNYGSQGILQNLKGIIMGRPGGQLKDEDLFQYDKTLLKIVRDELGLVDMPIMTQMDFGHTDPMFVIPYGVQAEIDCSKNTFKILESGVSA